jgi:Condensation domain
MPKPEDLSDRRARLTPAQRALLEKRLRSGGAVRAGEEEDSSITPRPDRGPAPASFGQRRLVRFAESRPASLAYNVYYAIGLRGPLAPEILARSIRAVVERHEALRTRFDVTAEGELVAVASPDLVPTSLPLVDLEGLSGLAFRDAEAVRVFCELATPRFEPRQGHLLRTALLRVSPEEHSLAVAVHHCVADGWSLSLFTRDLVEIYGRLAAGDSGALAPAPLQDADFASWQLRRVREGALKEGLAWWYSHLAGAPPAGIAWPERRQSPGERRSLRLQPELVETLKTLAQQERTTLFVIFLTGLKVLLHQWTGQTDLVVGTPMALRGRPEAAGIFGYLLNVLPLRADLSGDPSFLGVLQRVRDSFLGALAHRQVPVEWIAEELLPGHDPGVLPWVNVLFNMPSGEAGHVEPLRAGALEVLPLLTGELGSEIDLVLYAREVAGGIRLDLGFNANLFAPGEAGRLLEGFAALLGEAAACPDRRLSDLAGVTLTPAGSEI